MYLKFNNQVSYRLLFGKENFQMALIYHKLCILQIFSYPVQGEILILPTDFPLNEKMVKLSR